MGSLMAGWDSPILDGSKGVNLERNKSFTREEIDNYWKTHKSTDQEEHCKGLYDLGEHETRIQQTDLIREQANSKKKDDWWTRSSWAYLNEPPEEGTHDRSFKYMAQFHVAEINKRSLCAN